MPGFNPEQINIHDLTIEEPEKQVGALFDPRRDLGAEDWKAIENKLQKHIQFEDNEKKDHERVLSLVLAAEMTLLSHKPNLPERVLDDARKDFQRQREEFAKGKSVDHNFIYLAANLKVLGEDLILTKEEKAKMLEAFKMYSSSHDIDSYPKLILDLAILGEKVELPDDVKEDLRGYIKNKEGYMENTYGPIWLEHASVYRWFADNPNFTDEELKQAKDHVMQEEYPETKAMKAFHLMLLTAEKITVTDKGLEITTPGAVIANGQSQQLPEIRNF